MNDKYSFTEHIHRYACWTAARASQRGFRTTTEIISAIETSNLREIIDKKEIRPQNSNAFDKWHADKARGIIEKLLKPGEKEPKNTYGRAAKIIAIYLKTAVLLPEGDNEFTRVMHPPIDRILLQKLASKRKNDDSSFSAYLAECSWTRFDENKYFELIGKLRGKGLDKPGFWWLERFWRV